MSLCATGLQIRFETVCRCAWFANEPSLGVGGYSLSLCLAGSSGGELRRKGARTFGCGCAYRSCVVAGSQSHGICDDIRLYRICILALKRGLGLLGPVRQP